MTLDEIRKMLATGAIAPSVNDIVAKGTLTKQAAGNIDYSVHCGWDIAKAFACDNNWGQFNIKLLAHVASQYNDEAQQREALAKCSLEDHHWDWFAKAARYSSNEYLWFFLYAEGLPQAACLVYHPKKSILNTGDIFYVEYIAVAPWNRFNVMQGKIFSGIGTRMLKHAVEHCRDTLSLIPGFALHALPGAMPFYEKIGMIREASMDDGPLAYYEMPEAAFAAFGA